jgi:hypothetical protein
MATATASEAGPVCGKEAALYGAKVQTASYALGLGAVGSTSVDDQVTAFFSSLAAAKSLIFVADCGHRRRASASEIAGTSRFLQPEPARVRD